MTGAIRFDCPQPVQVKISSFIDGCLFSNNKAVSSTYAGPNGAALMIAGIQLELDIIPLDTTFI